VAEHTLFLEFATIVWALDIKQAVDSSTGEPFPIDLDRLTGFTRKGLSKPKEYPISITPRSAERLALLTKVTESEDL